jgi:phosphate transport system permease protein
MISPILLLLLFGLGVISWFFARAKARQLNTSKGSLHSLPHYHAWHMALWIVVPALIGWVIWSIVSPGLVNAAVMASPDAVNLPSNPMERDSILSEAFELAANPGSAAFNPLAEKFVSVINVATAKFNWIGTVLAALLAFFGGAFGFTRIKAKFPARSRVEFAALAALLVASLLAILTTIGLTGL